MARQVRSRVLAPVLAAAQTWINRSLVQDQSVFSDKHLWTGALVSEVYHAFVEHPDFGHDSFIDKLKGQLFNASAPAQQLIAEMLSALLLFPSNTKARTKREQIRGMWALSGESLGESHPLLSDDVLIGVGSGGCSAKCIVRFSLISNGVRSRGTAPSSRTRVWTPSAVRSTLLI